MNEEQRSAVFSDDRVYRYSLDIIWDKTRPPLQFIGLNPSTADEIKDDPTIRRCKGFGRSLGYGGIVMTNLFAFRATDPMEMKRQTNPIGERGEIMASDGLVFENRNDAVLYSVARRCACVIAAWGKNGTHMHRDTSVCSIVCSAAKSELSCLRRNGDGSPEHPLYLPAILTPIPYL